MQKNVLTKVVGYTTEDIKAAIPQSGISIQGLLKIFSSRLKDGGKDMADRKRFINAVKVNSEFDAATKLLVPKS